MEVIFTILMVAGLVFLVGRFLLRLSKEFFSGQEQSGDLVTAEVVEVDYEDGQYREVADDWKNTAPLTRELEGEQEVREALNGMSFKDVSTRFGLEPRTPLPGRVQEKLFRAGQLLSDMATRFRGQHSGMAEHCARWSADCFLLAGDLNRAIDIQPKPEPGTNARGQVEKLLSLKREAGRRPSGQDLSALAGARLTDWGQEHASAVIRELDELFLDQFDGPVRALRKWAGQVSSPEYPHYPVFYSRARAPVEVAHFGEHQELIDWARSASREAENRVREEAGVPRVGKGWVSETQLFQELSEAFEGFTVHHHYRPQWLEGQELDIYVEELEVGVEYQGRQHDEPIKFFGGEEGFQEIQRRDARKRRLCEEQGVALVEVRPGYDLEEVVAHIREVGEGRSGNPPA